MQPRFSSEKKQQFRLLQAYATQFLSSMCAEISSQTQEHAEYL